MKKLFVSLPMKGKTQEEIINRINKCKEEVEEILKEEDVVYCDSGYGQYRGCIVEFSAAIRYGIPIVICNDIDYQGTNFRAIYQKGKWTNFIL